MFEAENIRDWRDHDVVDLDGNQIGLLEADYVAGFIFPSARRRGADAAGTGNAMTAITKPATDSAAGTAG